MCIVGLWYGTLILTNLFTSSDYFEYWSYICSSKYHCSSFPLTPGLKDLPPWGSSSATLGYTLLSSEIIYIVLIQGGVVIYESMSYPYISQKKAVVDIGLTELHVYRYL